MQEYEIKALLAFNHGMDIAPDGMKFKAENDEDALEEYEAYKKRAEDLKSQPGGMQVRELGLYCGDREVASF